jgi:hypothetical protein
MASGGCRCLQADTRCLGFGHAEALENIQRLPENNPRRVRAAGARRGFRDSLEDLGLLVRVADLPR